MLDVPKNVRLGITKSLLIQRLDMLRLQDDVQVQCLTGFFATAPDVFNLTDIGSVGREHKRYCSCFQYLIIECEEMIVQQNRESH